jgi:hypothetical protein
MAKCCFKEWLYSSRINGLSRQRQRKRKRRKQRLIYREPPVMCEYGVKCNYGLVPSELGIGHYCGHMVDYDEVGYCCGKHEIVFVFLLQ